MTSNAIDRRTAISRGLSLVVICLSLLFSVSAVTEMNAHQLFALYIRPELPELIVVTTYNFDGSVAIAGNVPDDIAQVLSHKAALLLGLMNLASRLVHILPLVSVPFVLAFVLVCTNRPFERYLVLVVLHVTLVVMQWCWADSIS